MKKWGRVLFLLGLLVVFLVAIKLMGTSFKLLGKDTAKNLFDGISNPFAGLAVGILGTVLVQSSSVTTAAVVGMVGGGMPVGTAVPVIMGANIGTSITNTLVSMGHVTRGAEFRRAFAGATMHDFFNLMTVALLLPLELMTGILQRSATGLTGMIGFGGVSYKSPIKVFIGKLAKGPINFVTETLGLSGWWASGLLLAIALVLIIVTLIAITKTMRSLIAGRLEKALNDVLGKSGLLGMGIGIVMTAAVQSSSITTSLLVPLIGAGILTLEAAFPITLGANIGTTITALLAALASDKPGGLTIALVHLLFNLAGIALLYPIKRIRRIPLMLAEGLAWRAQQNKLWILVYIGGVFVLIPLLGVLLFRG